MLSNVLIDIYETSKRYNLDVTRSFIYVHIVKASDARATKQVVSIRRLIHKRL